MEWSEVKSKQLKVLSATAGAAAVVAMGAITVTLSEVSMAPSPGASSSRPGDDV